MFSSGDSVRQALAEDTANQLKALGISVKTEGVGWDVAYDRAQMRAAMVWGWGAHTPMELYNIYHSMAETGLAAVSRPTPMTQVDRYYGSRPCAAPIWKAPTGCGRRRSGMGPPVLPRTATSPGSGSVNVDHLYWARDGLTVAEQKLHPHGHGWSIVNNVDRWSWK